MCRPDPANRAPGVNLCHRCGALLLRNAMVTSLLGVYQDFAAVGRDALAMMAQSSGRILADSEQDAILADMSRLPAHPDVLVGLARLKKAGFRLATLSNNPESLLKEQIANAGLGDFFDKNISVDAVRCFKPSPRVYEYAALVMEAATSDLRLVTAYDWDVAGALHAGCAAAFVARPGKALGGLRPPPDIVAPDVQTVAERITEHDP